ncbi:MAG: (2Fe-2S)-binding protein [Deltaproteobacteria bacterium]|nr:(2Fe-2S)-binding protein [Deltaproteobacteria bacterium]
MERRPRELPDAPEGEPILIDFEGRSLSAKAGEPVAVTLLAHGVDIASRSIKYHRPRGAFCLAGTCGQCWMRLSDVQNRPACTTPAVDGLTVQRQNAFPTADNDVLRAADYVFQEGIDHNRLGTTHVSAMNVLIGSTARQLAGLGVLTEKPASRAPPIPALSLDVLVIGGGPAGIEAALASQARGRSTLLVDARPALGGHLSTGLFDDEPELVGLVDRGSRELPEANIWLRSVAAAVYRDGDGTPTVLIDRHRGTPSEGLALLRPKAIVIATGGYEVTPLFANDDLPGHYGARALAKLVLKHGVLPGKRVAVLDPGTGRRAGAWLHRRLRALGIDTIRLVEVDAIEEPGVRAFRRVIEAKGRDRIKSIVHAGPNAKRETEKVDVVASAYPVSPAYELAVQAGCSVVHRAGLGGFVVVVEQGTQRTKMADIFAAGDVTGGLTPEEARRQGAIAGAAAAEVA